MLRLNLAYDEVPYNYSTLNIKNQSIPMPSVVNENIANFIGYDSLILESQ